MVSSQNLLNERLNTDNRKLLLHKEELKTYLSGRVPPPITVEIDLSLNCSHRCPNCTFGGYHQALTIKSRIADKIIESIPKIGVKGMIITGGGEPCLYKNLGEFVRTTSEKGVDITLTTNGQQFHRHLPLLMHHLKRVRFSIDAATPEAFQLTHGMKPKDFNQVIENLQAAVHYKSETELPIDIGVSYLICDTNLQELDRAIEFYRKIGINFLHFKPMQLRKKDSRRYYYKTYLGLDRLASRIQHISEDGFRVTLSRENYYKESRPAISYDICHGAYFDLVIGADGKAYTCCHFKYNPEFCYGDLQTETMREVLAKNNASVNEECFKHCKMDALNQFVEYARHHPQNVLSRCKDLVLKELPLGSKWL